MTAVRFGTVNERTNLENVLEDSGGVKDDSGEIMAETAAVAGIADDDPLLRPLTRLTNTPATSHKNSKVVKFDKEATELSELAIQRFNTRVSLTRDSLKTPERSLSFDPCRIPETPLEHQPRTLYLLASEQPARAPPIKAWQGYGGNIYFEPVNLKKAPMSSKTSNSIQLYEQDSSDEVSRRGSLANKLVNYYQDHHNYSYRNQFSVAPVHYDVTMIEELDGKIGRSRRNWAGEERLWMRGLQSTGSLRLPSQITRSSRAAGSASVNFRLSNDALGRTNRKPKSRISLSTSHLLPSNVKVNNSRNASIVF